MRATWRLAMATGLVSMCGTGLYACSSSNDNAEIPNEPDKTGKPATPTGGEAGSETSTDPQQEAGADTTTPPPTCAIVQSGSSNLPPLEPAACKTCVAERCCGVLTVCFGSKPADAGLDGANGTKTSCQLFGECEIACNGNVPCEDACSNTYGEPAADSWTAADACLNGPSPAGCNDFCN